MHTHAIEPLVVAIVVALVATTLHRRLPPRLAARHIALVTVVVVGAAVPTLLVLTLAFLAHVPIVGRPAVWGTHALWHHSEVPFWLALAGFVVAIVATARLRKVIAEHRRLRLRAGAEAPSAALSTGGDATPDLAATIEVIDDPTPIALTLPGRSGRIVLSSGLLAALDADETAVVVAHEHAHARHRHDRYLLLGELSAAVLPPMRWIATRLEFSIERWADDEAAWVCGDRRRVAETIGKVALITSPAAGAAGFAGLGVVDRVRSLLGPSIDGVRGHDVAALVTGTLAVAALAAYQWHHLAALVDVLAPH